MFKQHHVWGNHSPGRKADTSRSSTSAAGVTTLATCLDPWRCVSGSWPHGHDWNKSPSISLVDHLLSRCRWWIFHCELLLKTSCFSIWPATHVRITPEDWDEKPWGNSGRVWVADRVKNVVSARNIAIHQPQNAPKIAIHQPQNWETNHHKWWFQSYGFHWCHHLMPIRNSQVVREKAKATAVRSLDQDGAT